MTQPLALAEVSSSKTITAKCIDESRRGIILPTLFPNSFLIVEFTVYHFANLISKNYRGAFWQFYELSNGGFYMSPVVENDIEFEVEIPFGNDFTGKFSADGFGILATIFAYTLLQEQHPQANFDEHYWHLRNFIYDHKESSSILWAMD